LVVTVKIAGMEQSQFNISLQKRKLTIAGIRGDVACPQAYHQMGVRYGEFRTEVEVPAGVDPDSLEANYSGGFLEVVLLNIRSCVTATAG
jgi:HSP20 family molecular chaperone IbpA